MQYVMGIDGGGTKTLLKLADMDGNLLACCESGPANINSMEGNVLEKTLTGLVSEGLNKISENPGECAAVCMGMAGAGRPAERAYLKDIIVRAGFTGTITVTDDAQTALYGGIGSDVGVIVISGTGSICFGRNSKGKTCRSGGWGHIIGDEGSGYDIGIRALKHVVRCCDGREKSSLLPTMVLEQLNLDGANDFVNYIYRSGLGKKEIAEVAAVVDKAAYVGDIYAKRILDSAIDELLLCTHAVINGLGLADEPAELSMGGSVLLRSTYMNVNLKNKICGSYPKIKVINIKNDAAWGAVLIALSQIKGREIQL